MVQRFIQTWQNDLNKIVDKQKKLGVQQSLMPWKRKGGKRKKRKQ